MSAIEILTAASHALRSYQYGNSNEELAKSTADAIDAHLSRLESAPLREPQHDSMTCKTVDCGECARESSIEGVSSRRVREPGRDEGESKVELPPLKTWSERTEAEIAAGTERMHNGGKDAGIAFFRLHPHLGFAVAVATQCELNERDAQLLGALTESQSLRSQLVPAVRRYMEAVRVLTALRDDGRILCERSPTKDQACFDAFRELNSAGQSVKAALDKAGIATKEDSHHAD